jgi:hypothetical protein
MSRPAMFSRGLRVRPGPRTSAEVLAWLESALRTTRHGVEASVVAAWLCGCAALVPSCLRTEADEETVAAYLALANAALETHGVGYLSDGGRGSGRIVLEYCNQGDPYVPTIAYDHESGCVRLTSWGDWLASWEHRHRRSIDGGES